ncbi:c53dc1a2-9451-4f27-9f4c-03b2dbb68dd1-CDS [Sclerotinia trifoliorum]|uniref:C53dc1a2-9451-4f27-9f4c-03b2dbb68dd1-CDS n=1 Tax=Sclerotinia trifoliorum TaxID=28548 RepID=A0A8H2ZP72_9HELO|nr:c53dc1a2-9451-4f27-9f4c-03b2dbb68dd1-CDS [Sclerotinia trifoliorum]
MLPAPYSMLKTQRNTQALESSLLLSSTYTPHTKVLRISDRQDKTRLLGTVLGDTKAESSQNMTRGASKLASKPEAHMQEPGPAGLGDPA